MNYTGTNGKFTLTCECGGTEIAIESNDTGYMGSEYTGWCEGEAEIKFTCQSCDNEVEFEIED